MYAVVKFLPLIIGLNLLVSTSPDPSKPASSREILRDNFDSSQRQPSFYRWNTIQRLYTGETKYNAEVDDVYVHNGCLKLSASTNQTSFVQAETTGKFRFRYGEVEARLRAPHGRGLVVKLILVPDRCSLLQCSDSVEDTYPRMYITELSGISPTNRSSIRSDYYVTFDNQSKRHDVGQAIDNPGKNLFSDFHVYRMVWKEDCLTWFIDGQQVFETTDEDAIAHSFMRLELSLYVGTGRGGGQPDEHTTFPAVFEIDYIVVRQENPYNEPDLLFSVDFSTNDTADFLQNNFIYGVVINNSFTPLPVNTTNIVSGTLQLSCFDDSRLQSQYRVTLQTIGFFDFLYGELQFRARFPSVNAADSPFAIIGLQNYLCGADHCDDHDITPEVSINQKPGKPSDNEVQLAYTSLSSPGITQRPTTPLTQKLYLSDRFRTYKLTWTRSNVTWFVDDQVVFVETDVKKIPVIRMYLYFTLFCNSASNHNDSLGIKFITIRQFGVTEESGIRMKAEGWGGWKYGTLFGILGFLSFLTLGLCLMLMRKRREKERLGWRSREGLSLRLQRSIPSENDYLGRTLSVPSNADIYVVSPENVTRSDTILGKGEHGVVFKGTATGLYGKVGPTVVAIKTLFSTEEDSGADRSFLKELDVLAKCGHHLNIVNLLGVVIRGRPSLLIEYCQYGSLQNYLREHRPPFYFNHVDTEGTLLPFEKVQYENESSRLHAKIKKNTADQALLSSRDLINFAYQVARGMEYLASRLIIHRDLAARNVLVDKGKIIKISDFGMARHTEGEYVLQDGSIALPVRWMSPSAVQTKTFNQSTDVWSYGVLLWEMFSLGDIPYGERKIGGNLEGFLQEIVHGMRLTKPEFCPNNMYEVMQDCWVVNSEKSFITFETLKSRLDAMISQAVGEYYTSMDAPYEMFNKEHQARHCPDVLSGQLSEQTTCFNEGYEKNDLNTH